MANGFSDWVEGWLQDWKNGTTAPAAPATVYFALHTADPGDTGANEVSTTNTGYGRVGVTSPAFTKSTSGTATRLTNTAAINFGTVPPAGTGYTATHWSTWTASTGGNCIESGPLGASKAFAIGDNAYFAASGLTDDVD